ncbi:MAG: AAA family ATPase [Bdellovibrionaceae bacterium]|nr:AAA family ATPase [Pseudobdellovibrionaceae bacterium]MBX3033085.1 AAA family ATPase [Pseudobdellovibrionaceae bacterium]
MARLKDRLIGHDEVFDFLLPSLQGDGLALTLLFAGPSGIGKRATALALAQALLCERSSAACGQCGSCQRVEQGVHESLLSLEPEGPMIKIDQAREVLEFLQLRRLGRARVVLIDQAQSLNPQAANSLLKILEEPPEGTFIFLIAPSPSSVLPTLRSRSRVVQFRPLTDAELKKIQTAPDWAVRAARGSVEKLRGLMESEEQETRQVSSQVLEAFLAEPEFLQGAGWRDFVKEKGAFPRILGFWQGFVRDGLVLHARGPAFLMNPDQKNLLDRLSQVPRPALEELSQRLLQLEKDTVFHRDPALAVEELWVTWRRPREKMA